MDAAATPQPPPVPGRRNVLDDLVDLLRARSEFGARKYGTRLESFNGRDAYVDALQELLDLFVYLHQAQMERAALDAELALARANLESHLAALDRRIETLKAERDAARANLEQARADLSAETAARVQLEAQLRT